REQRGNHVRLGIDGKADVAYKAFVENFVNGSAIVGAAMRFTHDARALGRRSGVWHDSPHRETGREGGWCVAAHWICSRRQSGMSEEQLQVSYHAGNGGNSELAMEAA